jgi:hypothetical protein
MRGSISLLSIVLVASSSRVASQGTPQASASPAMAAVADDLAAAFDEHRFVFLGSTHGDAKIHEFLLCLLSRPAFQRRVTDVLVEWGNPVHQRLVDRYLLTLEPVPEIELGAVWFDTDYPLLWARLPQIPQFYAAVRAINQGLEPARRIRVLGGCEPVDWSTVRTAVDLARYPYKNNWAAHVVAEHFALQPEKRLLVVYGDRHIDHDAGPLMLALEEKIDRAQLFTIGTIRALESGEKELVARLGDPSRPFLLGAPGLPALESSPRDLFYARPDSLASFFDAVLYLGPEADRDLSNSLELSAAQRAELARREAILGDYQVAMKSRLASRALWFERHPQDLPERP